MKILESKKKHGRPRAFDFDEALAKAMNIFWEKGYEGATLPDLTKAMGLNRPSLYAAFGNKEELFRKALERYVKAADGVMAEALSQPTAQEVIATFLRGVAHSACDTSHPRGCMLVVGALVGSSDAEPIRQELSAQRHANEMLLCRRFERAKREGDLPSGRCATTLARFVMTLHQGLIIQIMSGASADELQRVVEIALHCASSSLPPSLT